MTQVTISWKDVDGFIDSYRGLYVVTEDFTQTQQKLAAFLSALSSFTKEVGQESANAVFTSFLPYFKNTIKNLSDLQAWLDSLLEAHDSVGDDSRAFFTSGLLVMAPAVKMKP